jgi:predicted nucleic acid-binding protein
VILVDTAIWVDHLRVSNPTLLALLDEDRVFIHPFIIGELAVGNFRRRALILRQLHQLIFANVASDYEVLEFIDAHKLYGLGIGYVDCHLLASVLLTPGTWLWTRDRRLSAVASRLGLAMHLLDDTNGKKP